MYTKINYYNSYVILQFATLMLDKSKVYNKWQVYVDLVYNKWQKLLPLAYNEWQKLLPLVYNEWQVTSLILPQLLPYPTYATGDFVLHSMKCLLDLFTFIMESIIFMQCSDLLAINVVTIKTNLFMVKNIYGVKWSLSLLGISWVNAGLLFSFCKLLNIPMHQIFLFNASFFVSNALMFLLFELWFLCCCSSF